MHQYPKHKPYRGPLSHVITLATTLALGGSPAFATEILSDDFDTPSGAALGIAEGRDLNPNATNDKWLNWATTGSTFARFWNPSTTDRYTALNNEFYDTSWGGLDASGNADGGVLAVMTMEWDYRPNGTNPGQFTDPDGNRLWNASDSGVSDNAIRYEWRFDQGGTPDHVRDAVPAPDPFTYTQEVDGAFAWQDTASRDIEAVARIIESFDSTARYKVSVNVGRLALNGYNTGATILPGTDGLYGTADDVAGASTRFINDADTYWGGYQVDMLVGGDADESGSASGNFYYGQTTNSGAAGYMQAIASDDNTQVIAVDTWGSTTIEYIPGVSGDFSTMHGENLVVRLATKEIAGDHARTTAAAFDNVVVTKFLAGDTNLDGAVDVGTDAATLTTNIGQTIGQTWSDGDFNGDGDVDVFQSDGGGDAQLLTSNLAAAAAGTASATYNADTGELTFDIGAGIGVVGLQSSGNVIPANIDNGSIFGAPDQLDVNSIAFFDPTGLPVGPDSTGLMLPTGLTAGDMVFSYTPIGGATTVVEVIIGPVGTTYDSWSGSEPADGDKNGDGVENAVAYALGAADPDTDARSLLPISAYDDSGSPTYLVFTFNRSDEAEADSTTAISVEYGSDLSGWTTATHDPGGTGVIINETGSAPTNIEVKIPVSLAVGDKMFARLRVVVTP